MPVSTCRLAHLSLPNSQMFVGIRPEGISTLENRLAEPETFLLFPGPDAVDVAELPRPPRNLVVVDGTWIDARKLVERSPLLSALPRLGFRPPQPSNYRIRREPAEHCLSTIEAVAYTLGLLEGEQFSPMLAAFTRMVDLQLAHIAARPSHSSRHSGRPSPLDRLRRDREHLLLFFAEAGEEPALLQWVALRPATGEHFESLFCPTRPLRARPSQHLDLSPPLKLESWEQAQARWATFVRPTDVGLTWGLHPTELLRDQGLDLPEPQDLKRFLRNLLNRPLGGVEGLAMELGMALPEGRGRPFRRLVALEGVLRATLDGALLPPRPRLPGAAVELPAAG